MMKVSRNIVVILMLGVISVVITSCKEEKKSDNIITKIKPKPKASHQPQQLSNFKYQKNIEWLGKNYTILIERHADKSLPMVADSYEKKYYDNKITLTILHSDGTKFFNKTFQKDDFKAFAHNKYVKNGALIGLMFDRIEGNVLKFGASIGSPDPNSDEFIPIDVNINNLGNMSVTSSVELDTQSVVGQEKSEEKPKTALEQAEEDGM